LKEEPRPGGGGEKREPSGAYEINGQDLLAHPRHTKRCVMAKPCFERKAPGANAHRNYLFTFASTDTWKLSVKNANLHGASVRVVACVHVVPVAVTTSSGPSSSD